MRWSPWESIVPPRRPPVPSITIPSSVGSTLPPSASQRVGHGRDPVGLLAAQLGRVADRRRPLGEAGGEGDQRQLVDRQRDLGAADLAARAAPSGRRGCRRSARRPRSPLGLDLDRSAPIRSRIVSRPVRVGLRPTSWSSDLAAGDERRGDDEEGGRGEVGGDDDPARLEALGGLDHDRRRRSRRPRRRRRRACARCGRGSAAARPRGSRPRRAARRRAGRT